MQFIKVSLPVVGEEEVSAVRDVILSGKYISGEKVMQFEQKFSEYINVKFSAAVNSGTAALHVALACLDVGQGDEVIVPPMTFMSTITAVLHQNATPIFADIDKDSFCICPDDFERKITEKTKAVIPVHLYGNSAQMDKIMEIANKHGIYVVEDCAQAHGTEYKEKKVGSIGHIGTFSFFATKHITTGEGGIITSNNEEWIDKAKIIRSHGMINRDEHVYLGYNYRMTEIAAAMGLVQLKKIDDFNHKRINNSLCILNSLKESDQSWFIIPKLNQYIKHTFFWCPLIIKNNIDTTLVVKKLLQKGIETRQRYQKPLNTQKILEKVNPDYKHIMLSNAEFFAGKIIGLPNHPKLTDDNIEYIIESVKNLFN